MKAWIFTDTHFGIKNDDNIWLNSFREYFDTVVIPLLKKEVQPGDILVHCGDVFDNRKFVGLNTSTYVLELFSTLADIFSDGGIHIIVGNHDIYNKQSNDVTSLNMLTHIPGITVYKSPRQCTFGGKKLLMLPWCATDDDAKCALNAFPDSNYVFCHAEIAGCDMGHGQRSDCGLSPDDFPKAEIYAGHIHLRSKFKNVHYIGTPYQTTRTDMNSKKGIMNIDLNTGKETFFENTISPKFVAINVNVTDDGRYNLDAFSDTIVNNYVDIIVKQSDVTRIDVNELMLNVSKTAKTVTLKIAEDIVMDEVMVGQEDDGSGNKTLANHIDDFLGEVFDKIDIEPGVKDALGVYVDKIKNQYRNQ